MLGGMSGRGDGVPSSIRDRKPATPQTFPSGPHEPGPRRELEDAPFPFAMEPGGLRFSAINPARGKPGREPNWADDKAGRFRAATYARVVPTLPTCATRPAEKLTPQLRPSGIGSFSGAGRCPGRTPQGSAGMVQTLFRTASSRAAKDDGRGAAETLGQLLQEKRPLNGAGKHEQIRKGPAQTAALVLAQNRLPANTIIEDGPARTDVIDCAGLSPVFIACGTGGRKSARGRGAAGWRVVSLAGRGVGKPVDPGARGGRP